MNHKITLTIFVFLLTNSFLLAQKSTLRGKVVDASNLPIEFANVFLQNTATPAFQKGTITEKDGSFEIEIREKGNYQLTISFVGFEDWQQTFSIQESIDLELITLVSSSNELSEVVVKGERNIITRKEDKLIFNVATSPLSSGYDGVEVLQRSPNVIVDTEGNILMRNTAPTVMINGRITNLSGADLANYLSNLRSEDIKEIEIQTHLSANTDAESSGGVINIILKKKQVGFDGSIRAEHTFRGDGFFNTFGGLNFNYGAQKWNVYGAFNTLKNSGESIITNTTDYYETNDFFSTDEVYVGNFKRQNYQIGFVGDLAKNHVIGLEGYTTFGVFDFINEGKVQISNQGDLLDNGTAIATGLTDAELYNFTLNYTWTLDTTKSTLKFFADYAHQDFVRNNTAASTYQQGLYQDNTERNIAPALTTIYSIQSDLEKYFKQGFKLEAGTKVTVTERENTLFSDVLTNEIWQPTDRSTSFNYTERVLAGYSSVSKNIGEKNFVKVGLRVENTDLERIDEGEISNVKQNYTSWFPNVYYSRELTDNKSISLSYSRRLRRPSFRFLNNNTIKINDFRYELGNPDLIPENVNNWELSFKDKKQSIDFYVQNITEAINGIYYLEGQVAYYQKFNEGTQQQIGVSYNRNGNLTKWWYVKGLVSVYKRKFINDGGLDSFKKTTLRVDFTNNFKINKTTSLDVMARYTSPTADAYYVTGDLYRLNLMLQKSFLNKQLLCRIYVNDVFNTLQYFSERPFENFKTSREETWRSQSLRFWVTYRFNGKNKVNKRKNNSKNDARRRL